MIEIKAKNNRVNKNLEYITGAGDQVYAPVVDGKELNSLAETPDIALLIGLGYKYDGINSQFATMACRMLKIKSVYAE